MNRIKNVILFILNIATVAIAIAGYGLSGIIVAWGLFFLSGMFGILAWDNDAGIDAWVAFLTTAFIGAPTNALFDWFEEVQPEQVFFIRWPISIIGALCHLMFEIPANFVQGFATARYAKLVPVHVGTRPWSE